MPTRQFTQSAIFNDPTPAAAPYAAPRRAPAPVRRPYQPAFIAGKHYGCTKSMTRSGKKSKSFKVGESYLCVKNGSTTYLVTATGAIVESANVFSTMVRYP